ncbi:DUF3152 domain-containing protein [Streptomyces sp. NBC_00102]|uniref:DUF3152 domain-containing protein n=1 Tax=Streptomyces sp. NBC_00102 TaxID=2975652 RepID=UPI002253A6E9|nr:DUF3152 domain-containing protein [Streptomyces sp. NBC_00102]MCX5399580.1 DUF3152 domain-containing protein [Streptomyces sp. NBC_00102]
MGRHSRRGAEANGPAGEAAPAPAGGQGSGTGRRRRAPEPAPPGREGQRPSEAAADTPFQGVPQVRGGHPEHREPGGGWGTGPQPRYGSGGSPQSARPANPARPQTRSGEFPGFRPTGEPRTGEPRTGEPRTGEPRTGEFLAGGRGTAPVGRSVARPAPGGPPLIPGPRPEFVEAFDAPSVGLPVRHVPSRVAVPAPAEEEPAGARDRRGQGPDGGAGDGSGDGSGEAENASGKGGKGRTFTGIAAAAVTTVLAVVVAGQVAQGQGGDDSPQASGTRQGGQGASRSDARPTPATPAPLKALSYEEKMATPYPLAADLAGGGKFETVPGAAKAPGTGHKYRYRIDVEQGLGLDSALFAEAVQKTLNDDRSWAHHGDMTFERVSTGEPDFVITLASPGTTGVWCEKSGLDTTEDNVSCDSASTERVMINAYRWAQGSVTFGPGKLLSYRQMLINHEVGHRLGHNHVSCRTPGTLAPVMQQQTKSLDIDGISCKPNPWVYPAT